jgi:tetratricopeptide (TPR) repeat protein
MKSGWIKTVFIVLAVLLIPFSATAGTVADADALYDQGGLDNYATAIGIYEQLLDSAPDDFDLNWKCARACREYGETAKKAEVDGWKEICKEYGKKGMQYGSKAIALNPGNPAGHYFYGLSVGIYSDGTGILTALKEGLKDKTQTSFEKAYELDKMYEDAGSILALGRFWAVLPWPLASKKKSLAYYREYQQTPYFQQRDEGKVYLAELLIDKGGKDNKAEAGKILEQAVKTDDTYFKAWAERLMEKVK